ncbi:MAG: thiaminase II [Aigarchaeota archaeon]|nr:thiaminase II [Aigarchaeota archaeon]MDW8093164.1 thiaminase II [Nitrososphaerota archaeon]
MRPRDVLWSSISDVYQAIINHPFLRELSDGKLSKDSFRDYILQDAIYLEAFARSVAAVAVKADENEFAVLLLNVASGALTVERRSLHEFLMREWGIRPEDLSSYEPNPVNRAYMDFLLYTTNSSTFNEGLAAILPCAWVYREVGRELIEKGSPVPQYQRWIETYSSPEYDRTVDSLLDLVDVKFSKLSSEELTRLKRTFRLSTIYEYMFWDAAYRRSRWPFALT